MYQAQDRGGDESYASYYAGMNKSMRQKVALVSSFFETNGVLADMGSGSGQGSLDLACLYPQMKVIGVDINPKSVELSNQNHKRENLHFIQGDIADKIFEEESLDGILNSSVLHHVTSFNDFNINNIEKLLDNQVQSLKKDGVLAIRDFVIPKGAEKEIFLDLPRSDDTFSWFQKFSKEFKCSLFSGTGFKFEYNIIDDEWVRCKVSLRLATEFILRKDYKKDWDVEILEEYTYFSKAEFEREFEKRGLRIIISKELYNPWIVENRFEGKFRLQSLHGKRIDFPPTNYLIVGQKIDSEMPVKLAEKTVTTKRQPRFLEVEFYKEKTTKKNWELVRRPNKTIDILPWFKKDNEIFILTRHSYPRPLLKTNETDRTFDKSYRSGYALGLLNYIGSIEELKDQLKDRWNIAPNTILNIEPGLEYFPSAGGILESVETVHVEITPEAAILAKEESILPTVEKGGMRILQANQTLRTFQVGSLGDSRLELNTIDLLKKKNHPLTPWIGFDLPEIAEVDLEESDLQALIQQNNCEFELLSENKTSEYLELFESEFAEELSNGESVSSYKLEHFLPKEKSSNTAVCLPIAKKNNKWYVGLEIRNLPAAQVADGNSILLCAPAWRLPKTVEHKYQYLEFIKTSLNSEFQVDPKTVLQMGGDYYPSSGCTAENVSCWAGFIETLTESPLQWIELNNAIKNRNLFKDAHLLTAILRFHLLD